MGVTIFRWNWRARGSFAKEFGERVSTRLRTYRNYRAEDTDVPAAAKTVSISAWAKDRKD
jgi:hypothetical protein